MMSGKLTLKQFSQAASESVSLSGCCSWSYNIIQVAKNDLEIPDSEFSIHSKTLETSTKNLWKNNFG